MGSLWARGCLLSDGNLPPPSSQKPLFRNRSYSLANLPIVRETPTGASVMYRIVHCHYCRDPNCKHSGTLCLHGHWTGPWGPTWYPPLFSNYRSFPHGRPKSSSQGNEMGPQVLTSSSAQLEGPSIGHTVPIGVTSPPSTQTSYAFQSMELTLDHSMDRFAGQYPDLVLPVPGNPRISQVFYANTHTLTPEGNPLMIVKVEGIQQTYGTTTFAVDHLSGRFHMISRDGVTPLNLYGWEAAPPSSRNVNGNLLGNLSTPTPMATSTPVVADNAHTQEPPQGTTHAQRTESWEASCQTVRTTPPGATEAYPLRAAIEEVSSTSTLIEGEDITTEQDYEATVQKLAKVNHKYVLVMQNWSLERRSANSVEAQKEVDIFYKKIIDRYIKKKQSLTHAIEMYENFYQESLGSSSTWTPLPSVSPQAEPKSRQDHPKPIPPQPQVSMDVEETPPITPSKNHPSPQRDMREDAPLTSRPHLQPTTSLRGRASNAPTILTTATNTTPITREAGRLDALNTARHMLGRRQEPSLVMPVTMPRTLVVHTQTTPDRWDSARGQSLSMLPVGMAQPKKCHATGVWGWPNGG